MKKPERINDMNSSLTDSFIFAAQRAAATVERINNSPESLCEAVLNNIKSEKKVMLAEPDDLSPELFTLLKNLSNVIAHPTEEQMASIKIGITDAFAGVARTGSVCISITGNLGGSVSLYCREHIVILDSNFIVPRPRELFSENFLDGKGLKRDFVFITGPSATADMGPLVRGVHGPGKLHIIILE